MAEAGVRQHPQKPWDSMLHEFIVSNARIVATFGEDGGAIVEHIERLRCGEGRILHGHGDGNGNLVRFSLEYSFNFDVDGSPVPDASQASEARIVITGLHENGYRLEIRGDGWIGYDNLSNVEGNFKEPPIIITEESDWAVHDQSGPELPEETDEQFYARMKAIDKAGTPRQFDEATARFPQRADEH